MPISSPSCLQPSRRSALPPSALVLSGPHQDPAPSCLSLGAQEKAEPSTGCCLSSKQGGGELQRRPPARETRPSPLALPSHMGSTPSWPWLAGNRGRHQASLSVRLPGPWQEQMPVLLTQHICSKLLNLRAILNFFKKFFLLQNYFYDPFNKDLMVKAQLFRITFYCFHIENSKC